MILQVSSETSGQGVRDREGTETIELYKLNESHLKPTSRDRSDSVSSSWRSGASTLNSSEQWNGSLGTLGTTTSSAGGFVLSLRV